jgi:hypothetical protein
LAGLAAALAAVLAGGSWLADYARLGPMAPRGGWYQPGERRIEVPQYFQGDPRWGQDPLGPTDGTLAAEGCAVASSAMVLASYGIDVDPGRLNRFLAERGGYTERGWLKWEVAADYAPDRARFVYEDLPSHARVDGQLARGNPVIVRLRYPSGVTHFMVICGKRGFDYLVRDPGVGGAKGVYPLREFGGPVEALRYYAPR